MLITQCPAERGADPLRPVQDDADAASFVLPVLFEGQVKAVIELASLGTFTDLQNVVPRATDRPASASC